ncbi:hypothetical protein CTM97_21100 [Photobacterium phosphoreum]|uniref:Polysaccharide chain length determinant N-terminal domain-containing protein n=1 Tax=Photobacterium phosphoreum TaxID=659 RepID=A0A2T3JFR3_PHOPO|nr:Wzz/FepE/Etk N-terminal domain-containing protein [Photobacterium phosphoreum]PSU20041.1 hypothetical protein CTM96_20265 [Photobacterium phosphoreum]PSU36974.1 hypothetical protein CTM97_21100 [Photobacterium phosphoreum]PSU47774.1 hypothetical protein C9J18_18285 [Photobacterium phosphoreum]
MTNEIDISLFLKILWKSKKVILLSMLVFLCLSLLYSKILPRYWLNNINIYSADMKYPIEILNVNNINISYSKSDVTQLYVDNFNDINNKKCFIDSNKKTANLIERVIISKDANDNNEFIYQIAYKSKNKMRNDFELVKYANFIETIVLNKIKENVSIRKKEIINKLNNNLTLASILAKENRKTEINKNKYALEAARAAYIEKPMLEKNSGYNISVSQGVLVLEAKIKMLTNAQDLSVFNTNINVIKSKIEFINQNIFNVDKITVINNEKVNFISELEITDYRKNSFISVFLGFFIGVFFVFSKYLFQNKQVNE